MKEYKYYLHHIEKKDILYALHSPKEKIPCVLVRYYGNYYKDADYNYLYYQEIIKK